MFERDDVLDSLYVLLDECVEESVETIQACLIIVAYYMGVVAYYTDKFVYAPSCALVFMGQEQEVNVDAMNSADVVFIRRNDYMSQAQTVRHVKFYDAEKRRIKGRYYFPVPASALVGIMDWDDSVKWEILNPNQVSGIVIKADFQASDDYVTGACSKLPKYTMWKGEKNPVVCSQQGDDYSYWLELDCIFIWEVIVLPKKPTYIVGHKTK